MRDPLNILLELQASKAVSGISADIFEFILDNFYQQVNEQVFVFESTDKALTAFERSSNSDKYFFPGLGSNPYSSIVPSSQLMNQRFLTLKELKKNTSPKRIYTSYEALHLKTPPLSYFSGSNLELTVSDIIAPEELKTKLLELGYQYSPTIEEEGSFTNKGEIFDIFPFNGGPVRINYFDDMIEEIFLVDPDTLKTKRDSPLETLPIFGSALELISPQSLLNLRNHLYRPSPGQKAKTNYRNEIFHKLGESFFFDRYPIYISSLFEDNASLLDFLPNAQIFCFNRPDAIQSFQAYQAELQKDFVLEKEDNLNSFVSPAPEKIYDFSLNIPNVFSVNELDFQEEASRSFQLENLKSYVKTQFREIIKEKTDFLRAVFKFLEEVLLSNGEVLVAASSQNAKEEILYFFKLYQINESLQSKVKFVFDNLDEGFFAKEENLLVLSDHDLFSRKVAKSKKNKIKRSEDVFADQISTLKKGDFVIHKVFGVGQYLGIETIGERDNANDFLAILYENQDKVYVPVYKMDLVQKHADGNATIKLANLNSRKFEQTKARAKNSIKKLAFDLLELQARRNAKQGFAFSPPDEQFKEFEQAFPYEETVDQMAAIDDVIEDMQKIRPMDRLICGDVGFGKTEVAMRAAFKAVLDNKQVAILVPTTVLAYQHYNSFVKRFSDFPVRIDFLSRFKSAKQSAEILGDLANGKIDIVIGTHKLLSQKIQYKDLGLLVIDEEQRFGVAHKEKIKLFKTSVDCLTLTATPIPRTLQMSFLGIKDLSLIRSAPPKRQSIKTYVIKDDPNTLRSAIRKELFRNGQIFFVHNRVRDIEHHASFIKELVPESNIVIAHGQLPEKELEKRIGDFYQQKFNVLVCTTIIESGIDIPTANTLIVNKAHQYGLAQLHQLRGRIGRSDQKAYAYFITPHDMSLSTIAKKRLKALQTYADLGSGFSLAANDLEIRGSGDILGAEQSGHIGEIGLELYMDLLKNAIREIQGSEIQERRDIEIMTPFQTSIPKNYIHDSGTRLKYYKRLSNAEGKEALKQIAEELEDLYGKLPNELTNLVTLLEVKNHLAIFPISQIKVGKHQIRIKWIQDELNQDTELRDRIVQFFLSRPKVYKLNPDFSVVCKFKDELSLQSFLEFSTYIASNIDA